MRTHLKVLAVLFMVFGGTGICVAMFSSLLFGTLATIVGTSHDEGAQIGVAFLGLTGFALTTLALIISAPSIVCGWGLLTMRPWARLLGIVLAAIWLIKFPLGTVFGAYALWVFFQKETEQIFGTT